MELPSELHALLTSASPCFVATVNPDGSPQLTQTWVDTDGSHVIINTVAGFQKLKNLARDPRVAVTVADPRRIARYFQIRGRVLATTTDGAVAHIEKLSQRYLGGPYPWFSGRDQTRVIVTIAVESVSAVG